MTGQETRNKLIFTALSELSTRQIAETSDATRLGEKKPQPKSVVSGGKYQK